MGGAPGGDAATHRLVWSLLSKHKNEPDSARKGVNYNTYALYGEVLQPKSAVRLGPDRQRKGGGA